MLEYQNINTFFYKHSFRCKKLKILFRVISDLKGEEIAGTFYEEKLQKTNPKEFRAEKVVKKKKVINCNLNRKATIVLLTVGLGKKTYSK